MDTQVRESLQNQKLRADLRWVAKRIRLKATQVPNLCWTCISFGHPLALTCVDGWLWSSSNSYASRRKFFAVWPPNHKSTVYAWNLRLFATFVNLRADLRIRLATHRKSVRKFWFCKLASTCESFWPGFCADICLNNELKQTWPWFPSSSFCCSLILSLTWNATQTKEVTYMIWTQLLHQFIKEIKKVFTHTCSSFSLAASAFFLASSSTASASWMAWVTETRPKSLPLFM